MLLECQRLQQTFPVAWYRMTVIGHGTERLISACNNWYAFEHRHCTIWYLIVSQHILCNANCNVCRGHGNSSHHLADYSYLIVASNQYRHELSLYRLPWMILEGKDWPKIERVEVCSESNSCLNGQHNSTGSRIVLSELDPGRGNCSQRNLYSSVLRSRLKSSNSGVNGPNTHRKENTEG